MQVCDSFFTDYHWKPENLEVTMETFFDKCADKNSYEIYYGSDCYGRGTYGGGLFDVYKALELIRNFPFSIAIFGQAFTYEKWDSHALWEKFVRNEDLFWHGIERKTENLLDFDSIEDYNKAWNIPKHGEYGLWSVNKEPSGIEVVASHAPNQKMFRSVYNYHSD
jgi:mannosyl-glycoprotein endo-beta-N-acetylglucosaminidase